EHFEDSFDVHCILDPENLADSHIQLRETFRAMTVHVRIGFIIKETVAIQIHWNVSVVRFSAVRTEETGQTNLVWHVVNTGNYETMRRVGIQRTFHAWIVFRSLREVERAMRADSWRTKAEFIRSRQKVSFHFGVCVGALELEGF